MDQPPPPDHQPLWPLHRIVIGAVLIMVVIGGLGLCVLANAVPPVVITR